MFFKENCAEFYELLSSNENVMKKIHSSDKYKGNSETIEN